MLGFVLVASAVVAARASSYWVGDYPREAGPAIDALIHGRLGEAISSRPLMGPVSLVLRAPFAALSLVTGGGGPIDMYEAAYRFGVFPCIAVAGAIGVHVAERARRAGASPLLAWLTCALFILNPAALKAVTYGHPEEVLAGALVVLAALLSLDGRSGWAAVVAILAIATKQWAFLALPVLAVMSPDVRQFGRALVPAAALGLLVLLAVTTADSGAVWDANRVLFDVRGAVTEPGSIWWLAMPKLPDQAVSRDLPTWLGLLAHPLIFALALAVPLALARRVRAAPWERALPLLALVLLIRCMLDPVDNSYYHAPFFMALLTADALRRSYLPSLVAVAGLVTVSDLASRPTAQAAFYLLWSVGLALHLAARAGGRNVFGLRRSRTAFARS